MDPYLSLSLVTGKVERDRSFQRLIDSIFRHTVTDFELVVADASEVPYASADPRVRVIHEQPRRGHSAGYNAAFRLARGRYILWLNDDAEVCPDYDVEALTFMQSHPNIGLGALHYSENGGPFHVNEAWSCMYANFGIFSRAVGAEVGFFDEAIGMYGADNSFAIRILLSNRGVADIPKARIIHHSEKDQIRADNQVNRMRDNKMLQQLYMPLRRQWTAAYLRHRILSETKAWPHGVRPQTVTA